MPSWLATQRSKLGGLLLLFAILPTLFSSSLLLLLSQYSYIFDEQNVEAYLFFFGFTTFTMGLALTPTTFIAVLSGYFFGWAGFPAVVLSYLAASAIGLIIGKGLNRQLVGGFISENEKFRRFFEQLKEREFWMVVFGRLSPVLPFAMMNVAFSSIRVSWASFLSGSLLGMLPRTFVFFYTGMQAEEIWSFVQHPSLDGLFSLIPLLLVIISTIGLIAIVRSSLRQR